jgi:hypothetical protein
MTDRGVGDNVPADHALGRRMLLALRH